MSEQAATELTKILNARRAFRAFSDKKLDRALLADLFEAARLAPSAFNEQPWRFLVVTADKPDRFAKLLSCLSEMNQKWVKRAQAIIVSLAKKNFGAKNTENRWRFHDAGLALANFMAMATARSLVAHPMAGFSVEKVLEACPDIPADFEPVVVVAVGYHGDPAVLETDYHREAETAPRSRRDVREFVFDGEWDKGFA